MKNGVCARHMSLYFCERRQIPSCERLSLIVLLSVMDTTIGQDSIQEAYVTFLKLMEAYVTFLKLMEAYVTFLKL